MNPEISSSSSLKLINFYAINLNLRLRTTTTASTIHEVFSIYFFARFKVKVNTFVYLVTTTRGSLVMYHQFV